MLTQTAPCGRNSSGAVNGGQWSDVIVQRSRNYVLGQHAQTPGDFGKISAGHKRWWFVGDTQFETSRAPIDELDGTLGLDLSDGGVDVLWCDISTVQQTASHCKA